MTLKRYRYIYLTTWLGAIVCFLNACTNGNGAAIIREIHIGLHNNNHLQVQADVFTESACDAYVEYWPHDAGEQQKSSSLTSLNKEKHSLLLLNITPHTSYDYRIVLEKNGTKTESKIYNFESVDLPPWLQDQFKDTAVRANFLPAEFRNGLMLMNKRETPGMLYMVNYKGDLRWYHTINGTGFKVAHFTKDKTILSILGTNDEPTSYGSEILELNLTGDTILHLKKNQNDFKYTIHHEILKNNSNQLVTIYVDERVMDLSAIGGNRADTVKGDGIVILDTTGKEVWKWSVFDVLDPLKDPGILKNKKDWMHANSLNFDTDSSFIISFYNNGQIWKVNPHTGKVEWKLGRGGSLAMPAECNFTETHAVHVNPYGSLLFFDNGVEKKQSEVFALKLDEGKKTAKIDFHFKLPKEVYNERMGSAYMINDTTVLCCCSKRHITVLANKKGQLLWTLNSAIPPYRAEFLRAKDVEPYLKPL